ncbi:MAG: hypothetical protein GX596_12090 [Propionibacterium sp.]|nr:hypothetical protein [Propionibacterium sp.]
MTNDEWDPYATEELPVTPAVPDEAPTEPIPAVPATPRPQPSPQPQQQPAQPRPVQPAPPVETTAELPPWRQARPFPWGATVRRVLLRFIVALALLVVASLWSQILVLSGGASPDAADLEVPPVEAVAVWAALYLLITVAADVLGWWATPAAAAPTVPGAPPPAPSLPSRALAGWAVAAVVVLRPIHARAEDIEAVTDTASWMIVAYVLAMAVTVAVLRWLPHLRWPPVGSAQVASILVGTTTAILLVFPFTGSDYPLSDVVRPVYDWAFSWIDPGLGDGGPTTALVVAAFAVGLVVLVFDKHWAGLGRLGAYVPLLVVLLIFGALFAYQPWATISGLVVGVPLWLVLLGTRGPRRHLPR